MGIVQVMKYDTAARVSFVRLALRKQSFWAAKGCRSVRTTSRGGPAGAGQVEIEDLHDDVSWLDVGPVLQEVDREVLAPAAENVGEVALPAPRVSFVVIAIPVGDPPGKAVVHRFSIYHAAGF